MRTFAFWLLLLPWPAQADAPRIEAVQLIGVSAPDRPASQLDDLERDWVRGEWEPPSGAESVAADAQGWVIDRRLTQSYAYASVDLLEPGLWVMDAMGFAGVYVNGRPRIGNVYGRTDDWASWEPPFDFAQVPVELEAGRNQFLFYGNRYGVLRARFSPPRAPIQLNPKDATLPDLVRGEVVRTQGAVVVLNTTNSWLAGATLTSQLADHDLVHIDVPPLAPLAIRKIGFPIVGGAAAGEQMVLRLTTRHEDREDTVELELEVKPATSNRRVTFTSQIDGSVQYYGYVPPTMVGPAATLLSLHGAAVEAINQSASYPALSWAHVLAPTNRRPFGFDWERWGRLDALEVLSQAERRLDTDPSRVYLTGHSMGGHGTWHLGTLHPDRFAAIAPSAGWVSYWSYRREPPPQSVSALTSLMDRGLLPSRTLQMLPNLRGLGVYVLHGGEDDNVPPEQSHLVLETLRSFHENTTYHEEPGQGHWWDLSDAPGADCVAWPPLLDFLTHHRRPHPSEVRRVTFQTPNPAVSARHHWATVQQQSMAHQMSSVDLELSPMGRFVTGSTRNVKTLRLDLPFLGPGPLSIRLDDVDLEVNVDDGPLWLRSEPAWHPTSAPSPAQKGAHRNGTFFEVWGNRVQLVVGSGGTDEERRWALGKARYDAEQLWYKGNAAIDLVLDVDFDPTAEVDRNVVLYGNAHTHRHWDTLWGANDVRVERQRVVVGEREFKSDAVGVLAVRPRPGSDRAVVGIVAPSGSVGARALERRPVFAGYVAYPDLTVFHAEREPVVTYAGFFGPDWSVANGEFVGDDD